MSALSWLQLLRWQAPVPKTWAHALIVLGGVGIFGVSKYKYSTGDAQVHKGFGDAVVLRTKEGDVCLRRAYKREYSVGPWPVQVSTR